MRPSYNQKQKQPSCLIQVLGPCPGSELRSQVAIGLGVTWAPVACRLWMAPERYSTSISGVGPRMSTFDKHPKNSGKVPWGTTDPRNRLAVFPSS